MVVTSNQPGGAGAGTRLILAYWTMRRTIWLQHPESGV
jgi:hypothetical protein